MRTDSGINMPGFEPQMHHVFICGVTLASLITLFYICLRGAVRIKEIIHIEHLAQSSVLSKCSLTVG